MDRTTLVKFGLPIVILLIGAGVTVQLIDSREKPGREDPETAAALVETRTVHRAEHRLDVRGSGTVVPARQVTLQPEVNGRVVDIHPKLVPGGLVDEGETLVQLDRSDYELAVQQRKTALRQARAQLEIEKGQQQVAKREWELFQKEAEKAAGDRQLQDSSLALRKPQLMNAKAQVDAAESQLESARLNLRRTTVRAPFDALVRRESADVGQLAGAQSQLATLVGTDHFWIRLSIETSQIRHIDIPGVNAEQGSAATIRYEVGDRTITRDGRVVRLLGDLDPAGRMARVLVQIEDPLGLDGTEDNPENLDGVPLLLDSYVDVVIEGNRKRNLIELPRPAVHNGDEIYLLREGKLAIEPLEIVWRRPDTVLVASGVSDGDEVVTGPLPSPVEGMALEAAEESEPSSEEDQTGGTDE